MSVYFLPQQIRVYRTDGSARLFAQCDPILAKQALVKLNPAKLFAENQVTMVDDDGEFIIDASQLERIDLTTDYFSVWDFPFVLGAQVELTESEFYRCVDAQRQEELPSSRGDLPVFVAIVMASGMHYYFWMEVVGGLSAIRMHRIHSMFSEVRLIFGLRTGGVGVLNLSQMEYFSMYPEPPQAMSEAESFGYKLKRNGFGLPTFWLASSESPN